MRIVRREKLQGCRSSRILRDQIEPADGPEDQCEAVARYATLSQMVAPESVDLGSIVIVNGEPELNSVLSRAIKAQGRSIDIGAGKSFSQTLAGKLPGALSLLNASPHPDSLKTLIEYPCVTHGARKQGSTIDLVSEFDLACVDSLVNDLEHLESLGSHFREAKGSALMSQIRSLFGHFIPQTIGYIFLDCEDSKTLKDFLAAWIRTKVAKQFGKHPKAGIILQVDTAIKRIERAIEWHLADRAEGWILQAVEWIFPKDMQLDVDGISHGITGRIDRIDRNDKTNQWRIIDYKSGDDEVDPTNGVPSTDRRCMPWKKIGSWTGR